MKLIKSSLMFLLFLGAILTLLWCFYPEKWQKNYLGLEKQEVFVELGRPDFSGFEEYYWQTGIHIFDFEIFGNYLELGITPGQDQNAPNIVVKQRHNYVLFGIRVLQK